MKKLRLFAVLLAALAAAVLLAFLVIRFSSGYRSRNGLQEIRVVYVAEGEEARDSGELFGYETRWVADVSGERLCMLALQLAISEPVSEHLSCVFPAHMTLHSVEISGNHVVTVEFSEEYSQLTGVTRTIADYCVALTICELAKQQEVKYSSVVITVEGETTRTLRIPERLVNDRDLIRLKEYTFTVYFPAPYASAVMPNHFSRTLSAVEEPAEEIVAILMAGVQDNGVENPVVAPGTALRSVEVRNRICYLDFNERFLDVTLQDIEDQNLKLYAFVNSLCELDYVDRVQFLINGEAVESELYENFDTPYSPKEELNFVYGK